MDESMQEMIEKIVYAMGLTPECADLAVVVHYINAWTEVYPDNKCLVLHNVVVSLYEYLIKASAQTASGGGGRRERKGDREIEITGGYDKSVDWEKALDAYLDNPWAAFPQCRDQLSGEGGLGRVIVGGVDEKKIAEINRDYNIRTGGASECGGVTSPLNGARTVPNGWNLVRPWGSGQWGRGGGWGCR